MKAREDVGCSDPPWWLWRAAGLLALAWLILRSGANPRRLSYPCQKAALAGTLALLGHLTWLGAAAWLCRRLRARVSPAGAVLFMLALLASVFLKGSTLPVTPAFAALSLPAWTSPEAVSNVFVVNPVPVPKCTLAGGRLPASPPCDDPAYALPDAGVKALVRQMEARGPSFYRRPGRGNGIVGAQDAVIIKINNQWGGCGDGDGLGRLTTNTDLLKGLIWAVLQHPDGFRGEVVVVENTQGVLFDWALTPANAQDRAQTYQDVVDAFQSLGHPVSLYLLDNLNETLLRGGRVNAAGYPAGEYARGDMRDAYILLEDPAGSGTDELSYPKFRTAGGRYVSLRYGIWDGSRYDPDRLTLINVPVLKMHGMAGATIAWKNLIGLITISETERRYGNWDRMHDFFWGYTGGANQSYGLLGRQLALVGAPDLNVVDAVWVAVDDNTSGRAVRCNVLVASTDPFAADWYASEYVLRPVSSWPEAASSARRGLFRSASRTNQNAAAAAWPGAAYPYMDLLDGLDPAAPDDAEKRQLNVYLATPVASDPVPDIKAAGADGPVTLILPEPLVLTVSLDAGAKAGTPADWWVAAATPSGWYVLSLAPPGWLKVGSTLAPVYQGPLLDLPEVSLSGLPGLPSEAGPYVFYFAVDTLQNGSPDMDRLYLDAVAVTVRADTSPL